MALFTTNANVVSVKTVVTFLVAVLLAGVGSTSYAQHNNYGDELIVGALIGTVVGLSLASSYDGHRKKHHYHGDRRCNKHHTTRNQRHGSHQVSHHGNRHNYGHSHGHNNHHNHGHRNGHSNGYKHGYALLL